MSDNSIIPNHYFANESLMNLISHVQYSNESEAINSLKMSFYGFVDIKSKAWNESLSKDFDYRNQLMILNAIFQEYCFKYLNIPYGDKLEDFSGVEFLHRTIKEIHHRMCQLGFKIQLNRDDIAHMCGLRYNDPVILTTFASFKLRCRKMSGELFTWAKINQYDDIERFMRSSIGRAFKKKTFSDTRKYNKMHKITK